MNAGWIEAVALVEAADAPLFLGLLGRHVSGLDATYHSLDDHLFVLPTRTTTKRCCASGCQTGMRSAACAASASTVTCCRSTSRTTCGAGWTTACSKAGLLC